MDLTEFNEIRSYNDEELPQIFEELIADPAFQKAATGAIPNVPFELLAQKMRACKTKLDFQEAFCYGILWKIAQEHTDSLTLDHSRIPDHNIAYTYMSNHRDIILDSGFLSILLIDEGMDTVEIAIGDNLLITQWIETLVRLNKSFIVRRSVGVREMLESSRLMSRYMHFAVSRKHENIWIAQREGRAKDSDDRTQESVLKMMAMGGEGTPLESLKELNIVPLAISYEYDPCDFLKAQEFQLKRDMPDYKKSPADDLKNMQTGIFGYKGRIHYAAAPPVNTWIDELAALPKNRFYPELAQRIDREIHCRYRLFPNNYIAADWRDGTTAFSAEYTAEERRRFEEYVDGRLALIQIPGKDEDYLLERLLTMYANPLYNQLKARA